MTTIGKWLRWVWRKCRPKMHGDQIKAGRGYLAKAGGWIFEVKSVESGRVIYVVAQDGRECDAAIGEFSERVERELVYWPKSFPKRK